MFDDDEGGPDSPTEMIPVNHQFILPVPPFPSTCLASLSRITTGPPPPSPSPSRDGPRRSPKILVAASVAGCLSEKGRDLEGGGCQRMREIHGGEQRETEQPLSHGTGR